MSLMDTAKRLNLELEAKTKAEAAEAGRHALKARRATLYKENGARWFGELGQAMCSLAPNFNSATTDKSKHIKVSRQRPGKIDIAFLYSYESSDEKRTCSVFPTELELRVSFEFSTANGVELQHFKLLPIETGDIMVIGATQSGNRRVLWPEDMGRKATGDIFEDLTITTDAVKAKRQLNVPEFADYTLDSFVSREW